MSPLEVVSSIRQAGGEIWSEGDELCIQTPTGTLSPEQTAVLVEHKADLLPILARPPSVTAKLSKWIHRNREIATAIAPCVSVVVVLTIAFLWHQNSQARLASAKEAALRRLAETNLSRAEANLRLAESNLYESQIPLAYEAWKEGNVGKALRMLMSHSPDLRDWEWHYLYSLCHKNTATLEGHLDSVNWLA